MKSLKPFLMGIVPLLILSITANAQPSDLGPRAGQKAPLFKATDLEGKSVNLEALRGKPVVLIFWATWCGPCRARIPGEIELRKRFTQDELAMVAVSTDDAQSTVSKFVQNNNINFTVVWDEGGKVSQLYGVQYLPTVYIIDKDGIILNKPRSAEEMDRITEVLVKEGTEKAKSQITEMVEESKLLEEAMKKYEWGDQTGFKALLLEFKKKYPNSTHIPNVDAALADMGEGGESSSEKTIVAEQAIIGEMAGEFEIAGSSGDKTTINDPPGQPVALYFWNTENENSLKDIESLIERSESLKKTDLALYLINLDTDEAKVEAYLKEHKLPYPLIRDNRRFNAPIARKFGVEQIPSSVFIAPDGTFLARHLYGERFKTGLDLLLGEKNEELTELHEQDEMERGMITQAQEAWKEGQKENYYQILMTFIQSFPESPYTPKIKTILDQAGQDTSKVMSKIRKRVQPGENAPDFRAAGLDGQEVSLAQFTGGPLLLCFWTAASLPCITQAPRLNALRAKYTEDSLGIVAINLDPEKDKAAAKVQECGMKYTVLHDGQGLEGEIAKAWGVYRTPAVFLVDRLGKVAADYLSDSALEQAVDLAVASKGEELEAFIKSAKEARTWLDESEQILRESGQPAYRERLEAFLQKFPDSPDTAEVQSWLDAHPEEDADLSDYESLVGKSQNIRKVKKDFRILTWAMSEYAANHDGFPADMAALAGDDTELQQRINDPFGDGTYRYHSDGKTYWIILSNGPDGDKDVDEAAYSGDQSAVAPKSFDAAQGTESDGDLFITNGE